MSMSPGVLGPMEMPTGTQPSYNGLRGDELLEVIKDILGKRLAEHPSFTAGIAHHSPRFTVTLKISSFPYEASQTHEIETTKFVRDDGEPPLGSVEQAAKFEVETKIQ